MSLLHPWVEYGNIAMNPSILQLYIYEAPDLPRCEYVDSLRDFVPFVQFKNRKKHPWRSVT